MSRLPIFRVEHRQRTKTQVLGTLPLAKPHFRALDPFVSRLIQEGKDGQLVLIDAETGEVVARRRLPPVRRTG